MSAHAAILRRVAVTAVGDARKAWKRARTRPNEGRTRAAFRACVLAARTLRKAAAVSPADATAMIDEAKKLDAAAHDLKTKLVSIVTQPDPEPDPA